MRRARIASIAALGTVAALLAGAAPAAAVSASMKLTGVAYDPPSGPSDPACSAPLPSLDGRGGARYEEPNGQYKSAWEWTVPTTLEKGATATTWTQTETFNNGGASSAIALKTPFEFGANAGARTQIVAEVPVGEPGTRSDTETYRFTPTRDFVLGEKLYIRLETGCAAYHYEYTGKEPPSTPPTTTPPTNTNPNTTDGIVTVTSASRKVEVSRNESGWEPGTVGMQLRSGDRIHTGFKAGVVLRFPDGSTLRVGAMSLLQITDVGRGPQGGIRVRLYLRTGEVEAQVNRSTGAAADFEVKTPTSAAGVRGTVFRVRYDGTATTVSVTEGSVSVTANSGASAVVPAGMETRSTAKAVAAPVALGTGFRSGGLSAAEALARVTKKVSAGLKRCGFGVVSNRLSMAKGGWKAALVIVGAKQGIAAKPKGTARFRVAGKRVKARNRLARRIVARCR